MVVSIVGRDSRCAMITGQQKIQRDTQDLILRVHISQHAHDLYRRLLRSRHSLRPLLRER